MMNSSRHALLLSTLYSLSLTTWLIAQLILIEESSIDVQSIFQKTLVFLILIQSAVIGLLFISRPLEKWQTDVSAMFHILFFPLPFYALIWLTGTASLFFLVKSISTVTVVGMVALLIRQTGRIVVSSPDSQVIIMNALYLALTALIWNFHSNYWEWLIA